MNHRASLEIFCNLQSTRLSYPQLRIDPRSELPPFGMTAFHRQRPTCFDKCGNVFYRFVVKIHAEGHHCREIVGAVVRHSNLVAKIKFFPGLLLSDL